MQHWNKKRDRRLTGGFSLVELLVSIGIIGLLVALLLPALSAAERSARTVQCASNMRQLSMALITYANEYSGAFPPNSVQTGQYWYQKAIIGHCLTAPTLLSDGTLAGGILKCPSDLVDAVRSYSMNTYASSHVSSFVRRDLSSARPSGELYRYVVKGSSQVILLAESWSELIAPNDRSSPPVGYAAEAIIGWEGKPGERFGAGKGVNWNKGRFGVRASQIAFDRHRYWPNRSMTDPDGAANFAFVDGHVSLMKARDLADYSTGKSRYVALWSPLDAKTEAN